MKSASVFVVTLAFAFYVSDLICFDGRNCKALWTEGNHYGEIWQNHAILLVKRYF